MLFCLDSYCCLGSGADTLIQSIGWLDFEDGLRTGTKLKVRNGIQKVTKSKVKMTGPFKACINFGHF